MDGSQPCTILGTHQRLGRQRTSGMIDLKCKQAARHFEITFLLVRIKGRIEAIQEGLDCFNPISELALAPPTSITAPTDFSSVLEPEDIDVDGPLEPADTDVSAETLIMPDSNDLWEGLDEPPILQLDTLTSTTPTLNSAIQSWGQDFRDACAELHMLHERYRDVPIMALTTTANNPAIQDICTCLGLHDPLCLMQSFNCPNLYSNVTSVTWPPYHFPFILALTIYRLVLLYRLSVDWILGTVPVPHIVRLYARACTFLH
ncbi:uncharacterized protein F5147DRAFT_816503 [Suillus discolor]|uniref:Uncharacterized protein n=1 Tax=Suillus discolor TaxID=1912936 RepID=A0A9P7JQ24_9AGAM|nr:uncharacterized protein F5147DRAFT_816503 [Suillus discolor]KAG2097502.1 hypothetical protein F5147DRAFT_816503 [Suillus discolor]